MRKILLLVILPAITLGAVFVVLGNSVYANDILFEIPDEFLTTEASWGRTDSQAGTEIATRFVPINYPLNGVCRVTQRIGQIGNPTDNVVLDVYSVGFGGSTTPREGVKVASAIIRGSALPIDTVSYTIFHLDNCLDMPAGGFYWFVWSRSNPNSQGEYITKSSQYNVTYWTEYYWRDPNLGWKTKEFGEWSLRLETGVPVQRTPVLIIPGIAGTELYNGDDLIWPDLNQMFLDVGDQFLTENLVLDENGQPTNSEIITGKAIERILGSIPVFNLNIFEGLKFRLEDSGYSLDRDLFYFPYDWRLDLQDTAILLDDKIEEIKAQTGADKVNIVAHSMGGLLIKEYISQNSKDVIDKLIFIGTPHIGAPKAGKVILSGDNMGIPWLEKDRVKELSKNSVAIHELLPTNSYFDEMGSYIRRVGDGTLDYNKTKQLFLDQGSAVNVFTFAEDLFSHGLENTDFTSIETYNIAGCSSGTQGGYQVRANGSIAIMRYRSGDQTVPLVSADKINISGENKFYATKGNHSELPSRPGVRDLIADILAGQSLGSYDSVAEDISSCGIRGRELIWRSPVEVHIYDSLGQHTGPIENQGIEYGIPGVDYEIIGHEKYIFLPTGDHEAYQVVARGLDTGTFDLHIRQNNDGTVVGATIFNDIPVTTSTEINFDISEDIPVESIEVEVDSNIVFIPASAVLDDSQADDIIPPVITIISPDGLSYERSQTIPIEIHVSDNDSGVLAVAINLDDSPVLIPSIDLFFSSLGSHSLEVIVTDKAGNSASLVVEFRIMATQVSVISDIERAYTLGWISRESIKNNLIRRVEKSQYIGLLNELEREYNKSNINEQAYKLLKEDIEWLLMK